MFELGSYSSVSTIWCKLNENENHSHFYFKNCPRNDLMNLCMYDGYLVFF